jgi:hypothetical protein
VAISIKSITVGTATPGQVSVTTSETPTATAAGDIVVVFHGNNFYAATNMVAPTATGSPTVTAITGTGLPADGGTNLAHIKAYWYQANTAGAQTISETETGTHDEEKYLIAVVLSGADTSTPIDAAAGSSGASSASFVAPAVSPTTSDAFLIAVASDGGGAMGGPFTTPATYTEDADFAVGASNLSGVVAHKQLAASGSTGTITFTATTAEPWAAVTLAIKTGGAAGPAAQPWTRFNPGAALKRRMLVRQTGLLKEASKVAAPPVARQYNFGYSYNVWYDVAEKMGHLQRGQPATPPLLRGGRHLPQHRRHHQHHRQAAACAGRCGGRCRAGRRASRSATTTSGRGLHRAGRSHDEHVLHERGPGDLDLLPVAAELAPAQGRHLEPAGHRRAGHPRLAADLRRLGRPVPLGRRLLRDGLAHRGRRRSP